MRVPVLAAVLAVFCCSPLMAEDGGEHLLPISTVIYAEIDQPGDLIRRLRDDPAVPALVEQLKQIPAIGQALEEDDSVKAREALGIIEAQLGREWEDVLTALVENGVTFGFDPLSQGAVLILHAESEESLNEIVDGLVELANADAESKGKKAPFQEAEYRDARVFRGDKFAFGIAADRLVLTNKSELGRRVIDAIYETPTESLAVRPNFQQARDARSEESIGWLYVDLATIRSASPDEKLLQGKADDPGGEIILGGVLEGLSKAPYLTADIMPGRRSVSASFSIPLDRSKISEERVHYFGPEGKGQAAAPIHVPGNILTISTYRDLALMLQRAGDLFNESANDGLAKAETGLSTLFGGRSFSEDILGAFSPRLQLVVAQQSYDRLDTKPSIKLPAFALVAEMRDPEATRGAFRRNFMNAIGFFNIVGAMKGNPQLELDFEDIDDGELISTRIVTPADKKDQEVVPLTYNYAPAMGFNDQLMVISSTGELARQILTQVSEDARAETSPEAEATANTILQFSTDGIFELLLANREHLIAQNMLKEGHTRVEAETEIDSGIEIVKLFDKGRLELSSSDDTLDLDISISWDRIQKAE